MLNYTIVFLILALIAGALGFVALAGLAAMIAKACLIIFLILFLMTALKMRR